jgi:ubiquinone/menaquinone biosynthesis C-methylase UbiE
VQKFNLLNYWGISMKNVNAHLYDQESSFFIPPKDTFFLYGIIDEIYRTTPLIEFRAMFLKAAQMANDSEPLDPKLKLDIQQAFRNIIKHSTKMLYHTDRFNSEQTEIIGQWLHQEFISFCLLGTWPSRSWRKPQKIAGDHYMIKQIYQNGSEEKRSIGEVVNFCFLEEPACKAVINRKSYIQKAIQKKIEENGQDTTFVTSIASGPAEEIFDVYNLLGKEQWGKLKTSAIDIDKRACASADDKIYQNRLQNYFTTYAQDILKLNPLPDHFKNQDLVYSMGLIDYFKDRATIKIINRMYDMLKPGGEIIIGNFHISCESRVFLDYMLDWKLIYRTEEDMQRLFAKSQFSSNKVTIDFEEEGVNMLVRCKK